MIASAALVAALLGIGPPAAGASPERPLIAVAKGQDWAAVRSLLRSKGVEVNAAAPDGTTALHWAVHWDHLETVALLIRAGAAVNAKTEYGVTPLILACKNGNGAVAGALLSAGADANAALTTGETALMWAARTGSADAIDRLLARGADAKARESIRGQTALMWAAAQNHAEVIRLLTARGADVGTRSARGFTAFLFAAREGALEAMRALRAAGADVNEALPDGTSVLHVAAASGRTSVVRWLLEQRADPNMADEIGMTPLHAAFLRQEADPELVKALLSHGADPNARLLKAPPSLPSEIGGYGNLGGATPFIMAARNADSDMMRVLAAAGANPQLPTATGATALMLIAGAGRGLEGAPTNDARLVTAAATAIDLGIDVNATSNGGQTALHAAAGAGADSLIELLVKRGAALQVADKNGQTPLAAAERGLRNGVPQATVDLLRKLGG